MTEATGAVEIAELDLKLEPSRWVFAERQADAIASHWSRVLERTPAAFNGRMLLLGRHETVRGADDRLRLQGAYFETGYADFLAWRALGFPGDPVFHCFAMPALKTADGAFLLGEMASHTINAGRIYFPAGTPDLDDVFAGKVDLGASVRRELLEETGIDADEATVQDGWTVMFSSHDIVCMKPMTLPLAASEAQARIEAFLALDPRPELARIHVVRTPDDIDPGRTPKYVADYLRSALADQRPVG
jgi:8-oxo-dGTP pyrophosphatase MutT (NUDIX family)